MLSTSQPQTISSFIARRSFGTLLQSIAKGNNVVIERHGEPVAAMIPIEEYQALQTEKKVFFDTLRHTALAVNEDEKKSMQLALEAQKIVRASQPSDD